jgi:hypothetical protein
MTTNSDSNGPRSTTHVPPSINPLSSHGSSRYPRATPVEDDDDVTFRVPSQEDNSSILSALSSGPLSAKHSDASNSRVDLLSHLRPKGESSASLSQTEAIHAAAPPTIPIEEESDHFHVLHSTEEESSAVDLGSRHEIDVPLLAESQVSEGSAVLDTMPRRASSSVQLSGNAAGSFQNARSGLGSGVQSRSWTVAWRENPQWVAWGGGALGGVAVSLVVFAGLAASGALHFGSSANAQPNPRFNAELRHSGLRSNELQNRAQDLQAAALAARSQFADASAKLDAATHELQLARSEQAKLSNEVSQLQKQVAVAQANADRARDEQRAAVESAHRQASERLAKLTIEQTERIQAIEKAAAEQIRVEALQAAAARKALNDFQRVVNQKLSDANLVSANAQPGELLAAVDNAIIQRSSPAEVESPNADRLFSRGLRAYREHDFAEAEQALSAAAKANANDARIRYMLGLARRHLGRPDDAQSDFFVAAALERKYLPSPRDVDEILVRLPISDRGVVGPYRP